MFSQCHMLPERRDVLPDGCRVPTMYEGSKSSFTIKNHPLGVCFMQMSAFGTNGGWSEWSDVASINVV